MRTVLVNGCFDLLHAGHTYFLQEAKALGDHLTVVLNTDESVRERKGPGRPVQSFTERSAALMATGLVNAVFPFHGSRSNAKVTALRPDVVAYGRDVSPEVEAANAAALRALHPAATIVFIPLAIGPSTTALIESNGPVVSG